jgi:rhamnosyltransferase
MKVAVILASHNGERYIKQQIDSVINQKNVDLVIYVSDDCSTDSTLQILHEYNNKIKIISSNRKFGSAGQNFLFAICNIDYSNYDFVAFCDQDDIWFERKLINGIDKIIETSSDAYSSNVLAYWPDGSVKLIDKAQPQRKWDYLFEAAGPGCTYIIKSKLMIHSKEFLTSSQNDLKKIWLHDWFIYAFARSRGYKWFIDKEPYMLYRQHDKNQVGVNNGLGAMLSRLDLIKSGFYIDQVRFLSKALISNEINYPGNRNDLLSKVKLLAQVPACRRRFRDRCALFIAILCGFFK